MLHNLSIRPKVALILLLPALALMLLAGLRVGSTVATSRQADRVTRLTEVSLRGSALAHELERERGLSIRYLQGGTAGVDRAALLAQRGPVDRAVAAYRTSAGRLGGDALDPATRDKLTAATDRLSGLGRLRRDVEGREVSAAATLGFYVTTIADVLNTNRGLAAGIADRELAQAVGAFLAVSRIKELAALEREQLIGVLAGGRFQAGEYRRFTSTLTTRAVLLSEFRDAATDAQRGLYADTLVGPEVQRAKELQATAVAGEGDARLDIDPTEWWTVTSAEIDLLRQVEQRLGGTAVARSQAIEAAARSRAIFDGAGILLVLALALGLSLLIARSMLRPLRLLKATAEDVAHARLPGVVEKLQRSEPIDLEVEARPIGSRARDEIGQVARAFDAVQSVAVQTAVEQATLRRSVAEMFLNLGRRLQTLVYRQLELLDELERAETDPKQLDSLFRLDHLATRMRRNAENLLVLSGAEPVRRWSEPVPLPGVIRAASAEVEDYTRVAVLPMAGAHVAGHAVSDVVHLLAELIENAAAFSSPGTRVQITGEPTANGFLVEIEDRGIGMSPEELDEVNRQLAGPPVVDLALEQRLG
ncbi:MAG TPA: nitrate- and nitrite sensing domain-containing protein, partial [Actinomycetes bacterium]